MQGKIKWVMGGIAVLILIVLLLYMQGIIGGGKVEMEKSQQIKLPAGLITAKAESVNVGENVKFVGTVCSKTKATISSKVVARIEKISVKSGDLVKKDELLIKLEDKDINAKFRQTQAGLDAAMTNFKQAKADYERYKNLYEDKTITLQEFERAETAFKAARAQMEQAENAKKEAEAFLGYTSINAPFAGLIVKKHAEEGDMAAPGKPLLSMYDPEEIWFESQVPESQSSLLIIGLEAGVHVDAIDEKLIGKIIEIVPAVDTSSRTVTVRVEISKDNRLKCGMYGSFEIATGDAVTILIPKSAVKQIGQLDSVYVVSKGNVNLQNITLGKVYDDKQEVLSGISQGDVVVSNPDIMKEFGD